MTATRIIAVTAVLASLAACGQVPGQPTAGARPAVHAAALAMRTAEDVAKRILEEELNKEGKTFGEIEEIRLMETADPNVFNFTLVKAYQDDDFNAWEDTFVGTVDVKRRKVKAKRTKHEEV